MKNSNTRLRNWTQKNQDTCWYWPLWWGILILLIACICVVLWGILDKVRADQPLEERTAEVKAEIFWLKPTSIICIEGELKNGAFKVVPCPDPEPAKDLEEKRSQCWDIAGVDHRWNCIQEDWFREQSEKEKCWWEIGHFDLCPELMWQRSSSTWKRYRLRERHGHLNKHLAKGWQLQQPYEGECDIWLRRQVCLE